MSTHPIRRAQPSTSNAPTHAGLTRLQDSGSLYDVHVVVIDVGDTVAAAGGWIYERVRAGWQITAIVVGTPDVRPLRVLGIRTMMSGTHVDLAQAPASVAFPAGALDQPWAPWSRLISDVTRHSVEVTTWGRGPIESDRLFGDVEYRLSAAARAFKMHALRAAGLPTPVLDYETFRISGPWYSLDAGVDLIRPVRS